MLPQKWLFLHKFEYESLTIDRVSFKKKMALHVCFQQTKISNSVLDLCFVLNV